MAESREERRREFLAGMFNEAMISYRVPYTDWEDGEKVLLPQFLSLVGRNKRILDLAGGYGKALPQLISGGNEVILGDLSPESLTSAKSSLDLGCVEFIRLDINSSLPFSDGEFDGVWFAEAFEYVPPDLRGRFLAELRRIVKVNGPVFLNAEGLSRELSKLGYVRNYLYWRVIRRRPVLWGEYIYMLKEPPYQGWHYHSLSLDKRLDRRFQEVGFEVIEQLVRKGDCYRHFLLRAKA